MDCHYTLSSQHNWVSSDWIGLFKVPLTRRLAQKTKSISALLPKEKNPQGVDVFLPQVGWSSARDYHTFVWALAPTDYQEGTEVNCCVHFQGTTVLFYNSILFHVLSEDLYHNSGA